MTQGLRGFAIDDEFYMTRRTNDIDVVFHTSFRGNYSEFRDEHWDEAEVPVLY